MKTDIITYKYSVALMLDIVQTLGTINRFDISRKLMKNGQKNNFVKVSIDTMVEVLSLITTIKSKDLRLSLIKKLGL